MESQEIFDDVAGYIADHEWCMTTIKKAISSEDPELFLEKMLEKSSSTRSGDIRIILNRIRRI